MTEREIEIFQTLRLASSILECLRRGNGIEVGVMCTKALNDIRPIVDKYNDEYFN